MKRFSLRILPHVFLLMNSSPSLTVASGYRGADPAAEKSLSDPGAGFRLGIKEGLSASDKEISDRIQLENKLGRSEGKTREEVAKEIISDKFFKKYSLVQASEAEMEAERAELCGQNEKACKMPMAEVRPILEMAVLEKNPANTENVRIKIKAMLKDSPDKELAGQRGDSAGALPSWQSRLQIRGNGETCLVSQASDGKCLLNVIDFNRQCESFTPAGRISVDSGRSIIIDRALNIAFYSEQARNSGMEKQDAIQAAIQGRLRALALPTRDLGKYADLSDSLLMGVYKTHYKEVFRQEDSLELKILGSTDSNEIRAVWKAIGKSGYPLIVGKKGVSRRVRDSIVDISLRAYSWKTMVIGESDGTFQAVCDTLGEKEFSAPVLTKYGYFILYLNRIKPAEIPDFESAKPRLMRYYVECLGKKNACVNPGDHDAAQRSVFPESTLLRVWSFVASESVHDTLWESIKARVDSSTHGSLVFSLSDFPQSIQPEIAARMRRKPLSVFGPVHCIYGDWYVQNTGLSRKAQARQAPPVATRPTGYNGTNGTSDFSGPVAAKMVEDEVLAYAFWTGRLSRAKDPTDERLAEDIRKGRIDTTTIPKNYGKDERRRYLNRLWADYDSKRELMAWKAGLYYADLSVFSDK